MEIFRCGLAETAGLRCPYDSSPLVERLTAELPRIALDVDIDCPFSLLMGTGYPHIRVPTRDRLLGAIAIQVTTMREIDAGLASHLEALVDRRFPRRHDG